MWNECIWVSFLKINKINWVVWVYRVGVIMLFFILVYDLIFFFDVEFYFFDKVNNIGIEVF